MSSRMIGSSAKIVLKREDHLPRSHCDAIEIRPSTVVAEEPVIREARPCGWVRFFREAIRRMASRKIGSSATTVLALIPIA